MDSFESIPVSRLEEGTPLNIQPYRNEYSPFSRIHEVGPAAPGDEVLVDTYYGLAYDPWIRAGGVPYGLTDKLPKGPLDDLAAGYLRIPFARIPCIKVRDKVGLMRVVERIKQSYPDLPLLFRGQSSEYLLNRRADTLEALYGDRVQEPSLLPSADRRGINIDMVGPVWCGTLRWFLDLWATKRKDDAQYKRIHEVGQHYLFHRFALAMAQHYGLPSSGLDVTDSIETALFFALHSFSRSQTEPNILLCSRTTREGSAPVLYIFGVEIDMHYISFEGQLLGELPNNRPSRQSAFFLHRGWGMARNQAACNLLVALYPDLDGDYGTLPMADYLFPGPKEDLFGVAIESAKRYIGDKLPELNRLVQDFAWVQAGP